MAVKAEFNEKLQCLFEPKRYKILWGGRSAGRSWGCARALLLLGTKSAIRVLCVRELQNSIAESVHKLLSDQIEALGLGHFYDIQKAQIIGKNGTTFSFDGIKNNVNKIKSYEGIDYCWVEEANKVSRNSWMTLIPTIRKMGSEIWITFNPELEKDYTYQRFVLKPSGELLRREGDFVETSDSYVVKMSWRDLGQWFTPEMANERDDLKVRDYDSYLNVWEGHPLQMLEGAVFAKQLRQVQEQGRICKVPVDFETPVDTFWDLGRRDHTCIWFGQRVGMQYRLLHYFEDTGQDIQYYLKYCQNQSYMYGTFYLPHDASAKRLGEKRTIEQTVRKLGYNVHIVPRVHKKVNAINAARLVFPQCWFDEEGTADGLDRLRHYCYTVKDGQFSEEPHHDEASDGADAFMTMAQGMMGPRRTEGIKQKLLRKVHDYTDVDAGQRWMR